jgi:hypothetical protein
MDSLKQHTYGKFRFSVLAFAMFQFLMENEKEAESITVEQLQVIEKVMESYWLQWLAFKVSLYHFLVDTSCRVNGK